MVPLWHCVGALSFFDSWKLFGLQCFPGHTREWMGAIRGAWLQWLDDTSVNSFKRDELLQDFFICTFCLKWTLFDGNIICKVMKKTFIWNKSTLTWGRNVWKDKNLETGWTFPIFFNIIGQQIFPSWPIGWPLFLIKMVLPGQKWNLTHSTIPNFFTHCSTFSPTFQFCPK